MYGKTKIDPDYAEKAADILVKWRYKWISTKQKNALVHKLNQEYAK